MTVAPPCSAPVIPPTLPVGAAGLRNIYIEGVPARGLTFSIVPELLQQISAPVENLTFPKRIKTG